MTGWKKRALVALGVAVFCVAPMVGTADAATTKQLAKALKKEHKARVAADRNFRTQLAADEDALGMTIGLLTCFQVVGTGVESFVPPGAVDPIAAFTLSTTGEPVLWTATVAAECVDTSASSSARARAFRSFFPKAGVR